MDRPFQQVDYTIGQNLKIYERIKQQLDNRTTAAHDVRTNIGDTIVSVTPNYENENINPGTATGVIMAGIATVLDQYAVPMSADTEVADVESVENGTKYTVNVDAGFRQQARFRGMMEAGSGYTSFFTDGFEVSDMDSIRERLVRDTWQMDVVVEDPQPDQNQKSKIGLGLFNS